MLDKNNEPTFPKSESLQPTDPYERIFGISSTASSPRAGEPQLPSIEITYEHRCRAIARFPEFPLDSAGNDVAARLEAAIEHWTATLARTEKAEAECRMAGIGDYQGNYYLGHLTTTGALREHIGAIEAKLEKAEALNAEMTKALTFAQEIVKDQAERFHQECRCMLCESLPMMISDALLAVGTK